MKIEPPHIGMKFMRKYADNPPLWLETTVERVNKANVRCVAYTQDCYIRTWVKHSQWVVWIDGARPVGSTSFPAKVND